MELAKRAVVPRHRALALKHVHLDACLAVGRRREVLAFLAGNGGVALDQRRHDAAQRLDPERQRGHVEQQQVLDLAGQHTRLQRGPEGDHLIGIDPLVRVLAEQLLDDRLHPRHPCGPADHDDLVDLRRLEPRVRQRLLDRADRFLQQLLDQLLETRPTQRHRQMLWTGLICGHERQVDLGLDDSRQLHLRLLRRLLEPLQGHPILPQIDPVALHELVGDPLDDALVEVVATQVRVAVGGLDFHDAFADLENRNVERAAAEVVHRDRFVLLLVQPVGQRRGRRLIHDPEHLETGDLAGVLGRLALGVVEVGGYGDHRLGNRLAEILLGGLSELLQDHGGDFRRRRFLASDLDPGSAVRAFHHLVRHHLHLFIDLVVLAAHEALDGEHRVLRVGDRLTLGDLPHQTLARLGECHDGRSEPIALRVGHNDRFPTFHDGDNRVGRSEIDSDYLTHNTISCKSLTMITTNMVKPLYNV